MKKELVLSVDWLGVTFRPVETSPLSPLDQFFKMFPEFDDIRQYFVIDKKLKNHYDLNIVYGDRDIIISYNTIEFEDRADSTFANRWRQGVNIQIPSHSLPLFLNILGLDVADESSFIKCLRILNNRSCTLSRLDLCFDDFEKGYTTFDYIKAWTDGRLQSKYIQSITTMGSKQKGFTMYFGSLKRRTKVLRIYDKFLESKGVVDSVRYEFEFHNQEATNIMYYLLKEHSEGIEFSTFLYNWVRLKVENNCATISDVADDPDWILYLAQFLPNFDEIKDLDVKSQFNAIIKYFVPVRIFNLKKFPEDPLYSDEVRHNYYYRNCIPTIVGQIALYGWDKFENDVSIARSEGRMNERYKRELTKLKNSGFMFKNFDSADMADYLFKDKDDCEQASFL